MDSPKDWTDAVETYVENGDGSGKIKSWKFEPMAENPFDSLVYVPIGDFVLPSRAELDAHAVTLQAEFDALQYYRDREFKYPTLPDQLDMQYHDSVDGTTTWVDALAKVKSDNPKP